jgi:hypothetical protein
MGDVEIAIAEFGSAAGANSEQLGSVLKLVKSTHRAVMLQTVSYANLRGGWLAGLEEGDLFHIVKLFEQVCEGFGIVRVANPARH